MSKRRSPSNICPARAPPNAAATVSCTSASARPCRARAARSGVMTSNGRPVTCSSFHIGGAFDAIGHGLDALAGFDQLIQVVAMDLDGDFGAHAGDELVHAHLHGLRELVVVAGDRAHRLFEFLDQLPLGFARIRPFAARSLSRTKVSATEGGIGSVAMSAVPSFVTTSRTSGNCLSRASSCCCIADGLGEAGARNAQGVHGDVAFVEIRDELGAEARGQPAGEQREHGGAGDHGRCGAGSPSAAVGA